MPALSFSVFRDKIESGTKRQTIRAIRKNPIKSGDRLLMYWKQRSPKNCEKLGDAICTKVSDVIVMSNGVNFRKKFLISNLELNEFAIADGFDNWDQMLQFFDKNYGLPFTGVLIEWDSIKSPF